ncbi:hypothetical protein FJY93_03720 [Candidatus Kaiserbacteria bacterium]|nr:hypothetical protein [Candidatus Kaiserbacteria bacterium]
MSKGLQLPSGKTLCGADHDLLKRWHKIGVIKFDESKPYDLRSGKKSCFYVSARDELSQHTDVLCATGDAIARTLWRHMANIRDDRKPFLLGLPTAGRQLAQAAAESPRLERGSLERAAFADIREVQKTSHGLSQHRGGWVVGTRASDHDERFRDILIDNAVSSGGTVADWIPRLEEDGYRRDGLDLCVLIDHERGAASYLKIFHNIRHTISVFWMRDIAYVYVHILKVWPEQAVDILEEEIESRKVITKESSHEADCQFTLSEDEKTLLSKIHSATKEEIDKSLVDAGVYTADGRLTKKYGGDA